MFEEDDNFVWRNANTIVLKFESRLNYKEAKLIGSKMEHLSSEN